MECRNERELLNCIINQDGMCIGINCGDCPITKLSTNRWICEEPGDVKASILREAKKLLLERYTISDILEKE